MLRPDEITADQKKGLSRIEEQMLLARSESEQVSFMIRETVQDPVNFSIGGVSSRLKSSTEHNARPSTRHAEGDFLKSLIETNLSAVEEPTSATDSEKALKNQAQELEKLSKI